MLVGELDEVTYDLEVDGEQVRRVIHRTVLERGAWATVAMVYEERAGDGSWKPGKLVLIRLQKVREAWKKHAALTLAGEDAIALVETISTWRGELVGNAALVETISTWRGELVGNADE